MTFFSQNVKNYNISDGLPGNSIKCIFKDSRGLLWIATETGLCIYDGTNFKIIGEDQGLKYTFIWKIIEDPNKNIWLSTYGEGIAKFDGNKFTYYNKKNGLINDAVRSMCYSKKYKCLILGTEDGLSVYDGNKFLNFRGKSESPTSKFQVNFIKEAEGKIFFAAAYDNLYELVIEKSKNQKLKVRKIPTIKNQNYSGFLSGDFYYNLDYYNVFVAQNLKTGENKIFPKCSNIWDFTKSKNHNIYMACCDINTPTGGILCYDNKNLVDITKELKLTSSQFWCLYYDTITEQLWAGSTDQGVFVVNINNSILESNPLLFQKIKPEINSMCMDNKGNLFLGGNNFIAQKKGGKSICLSSNQIKKKVLAFISAHHSKIRVSDKDFIAQSNTFVCNCIKCDNDGKIWAITNYGLIKFNEKFEIENYVYINETNGVFEFFNQNKMLLSQFYNSSYGINFNSYIETSILKYKHHSINLNANKISKGKNHLWISTISKGLFLFENGILLSMHDLGFLNDKNTSEVIEDDQNNVITGTFSGKVFFSKWINRKLIHNRVLKPEIDIIGSTIFFIRKYKKYYLIGTNKGINIIRNYKLIKFLNKEENLIQTQYTDAIIDFKQKKLIVSSYKGLMEIDLESVLSSKKVNSPIQIKQIKINDKIIATADKIELSHDQNNIDIQFGSNNIYNPSKNRYSYKIIGLSNKWSEYNSETNLKLFNLNYGKYTILVRGKNIGTNEKIRSAILNITILPPFWKTAWFVILNVILISTLTFLYIKRKIRQIQEKANIDKRIAETKLQALQSQMNPHFVFNAMNSIQNFVIDNQTDDALWYIGEFSKMMRQTLNFSSRKSVRLEEEIEYLRRYIDLENLRRNDSVIYKIIVDENIDQNEIEIPPMLIQPIVENVFVHAFDSLILKPMLTIEIHLKDENLLCVIKDNGKGLDLNKANPTNSKGIQLTEERINLIEANELKNVVVESIPSGGICVSLSIPVR